MKKSIQNKIRERIENKPCCFVDASVFVEILLKQKRSGECLDFLHRARHKYRIMVSTTAMGEVLKAIAYNDEKVKTFMFISLEDLISMTCPVIPSVSFLSINNVNAVRDADSFLPSSDCLIFSSAITEQCNAFVTLDHHFTMQLGTIFCIHIKKPSEA